MRKPNPNVIAPAPMIVQEGYSPGEGGYFFRAKAKKKFLICLEGERGNIDKALRKSGVSRESFATWLEQDLAFSRKFGRCIVAAAELIEAERVLSRG